MSSESLSAQSPTTDESDDFTSTTSAEGGDPRLHDGPGAHLPGVTAPSPAQHLAAARIDVDRRVPAVHVWRDFRATPEQVMRAHTDATLFAQWIGPRDMTTEIDVWDCRTLGSYRFVQRRGDETYAFRGTFPEVSERRLVQTFCFEEWPGSVSLETTSLTDLGDGRTRLHGFSLYDSFEARDGMLATGMETGVQQGYEKLDHLLRDLGAA